MTSRSEKNCNDFHKHVKYYKLWDLAASPDASKQMQPLGCACHCGRLKWGAPSLRAAWLHLHFAREKCMQIREQKKIYKRSSPDVTFPPLFTVRVMYWKSLFLSARASRCLILLPACSHAFLITCWGLDHGQSRRAAGGQLERSSDFDHLTICEYNSWPHVLKDNWLKCIKKNTTKQKHR